MSHLLTKAFEKNGSTCALFLADQHFWRKLLLVNWLLNSTCPVKNWEKKQKSEKKYIIYVTVRFICPLPKYWLKLWFVRTSLGWRWVTKDKIFVTYSQVFWCALYFSIGFPGQNVSWWASLCFNGILINERSPLSNPVLQTESRWWMWTVLEEYLSQYRS